LEKYFGDYFELKIPPGLEVAVTFRSLAALPEGLEGFRGSLDSPLQ
jgi:hypothetical protein